MDRFFQGVDFDRGSAGRPLCWRAFLKAAEIDEPVSLHDVRRTLGSSLAKSGAAAATISKALGHVSPQSARAYVHLDVEPARAAIEKALGDVCNAS